MTERRPVIGISCYVESVDRDPWVAQPSAVLPLGYLAHIWRAGGLAVVLPPRRDADADADAAELLDRVDGLILAGGADVEPRRYTAAPHPSVQAPRPDRDDWELALSRESARRDLPVLGICRGMQVMAVEAGGALQQHLPERVGGVEHLPVPGVYTGHVVTPIMGTRVGDILGGEPLDVPTYHHQGVDTHPGYEPSAWHADGTLEAMEDPDASFRLAVQWHPEAGEDNRLFAALVASARQRSVGAPS